MHVEILDILFGHSVEPHILNMVCQDLGWETWIVGSLASYVLLYHTQNRKLQEMDCVPDL